jgi:hypothetical protein
MNELLPVVALATGLALALPANAHQHATATATATNPSEVETAAALRDLWVEHVFWARNYVLASAAGDSAQGKVAADQVVANAKAIAGAVGSYYGKAAGDGMLTLLAGHWGAVRAYADASFAHQAAAQQQATAALTANAREIAAFLAGANPYLPEQTLVALLTAHGAHHVSQVQQVAAHDYAAEAATWAAMRIHMLAIADALAGALAKQFPSGPKGA